VNKQWDAISESKKQERQRLAALPFSEKVAILEKLRDRARSIADSPLRKTRLAK
jgi:hypothetical protein